MMSSLEYLSVGGNNITGTIPEAVYNLDLIEMVFDRTNISGTISSKIGQLTNLRYFYGQYSRLSGSIPSQVGTMENLYDIFLGSTGINSTVPEELFNLTRLNRLDLSNTSLSGAISLRVEPSLNQLCV